MIIRYDEGQLPWEKLWWLTSITITNYIVWRSWYQECMLLKWQQSQVLRSVSDFPFYADAMMPVIITGMSIKPVITDCHHWVSYKLFWCALLPFSPLCLYNNLFLMYNYSSGWIEMIHVKYSVNLRSYQSRNRNCCIKESSKTIMCICESLDKVAFHSLFLKA